ncbi:sensor histidine kinase [Halobaculum sp. MBLA0147]|uniref:sensor histidine kinase n=1 Tax=Halobaculum sp. MBLA0147 TaxID=3079934 RepID=UPI003525AEF1
MTDASGSTPRRVARGVVARVGEARVLVVVSCALLAVPLYDVVDDVVADGTTLASTLVENALFLLLTIGFVVASFRLARSDWREEHVSLVARWSLFGTVSVTLVYLVVLGIQIGVQGRYKPLVIAADGVVVGGLVTFVAGLYHARGRRAAEAARVERDRAEALFDNAGDAMLAVKFVDGEPVVQRANRSFRETFDTGERELSDTRVGEVLDDRVVARAAGDRVSGYENRLDGVAGESTTTDGGTAADGASDVTVGGESDHGRPAESENGDDGPTSVHDLPPFAGDPEAETELRVSTPDGVDDFLVDFVPVTSVDPEPGVGVSDAVVAAETSGRPPGSAADERAAGDERESSEGYLVFTDIGEQKERARQFDALAEGVAALFDAREPVAVADAVRNVLTELFDDAVVGVWAFDPDDEVFRPVTATAESSSGEPVVSSVPVVDTAHDGSGGAVDDEGRRESPLSGEERGTATADDDGVGELAGGRGPRFRPVDDGITLDTDELAAALADRGTPPAETVTRRLGGSHRLVVARTEAELEPAHRHVVDLLANNADAAIERAERETELERRADQLEFVNSLIRHDVQNAMTVVRSRGEVLAETLDGREESYAETVVDRSETVIDLVDRFRALLDALADERGESVEPVHLEEPLTERVENLRARHRNVSVEVTGETDVTVAADEMVGNVIGNVLDNAVDHHDGDEPSVTVSVTPRDQTVAVRIADDGPGIPDEEKEAVFRRGNRGLKDADIGSGFGLFFVDAMLERYGGDASVEDNEMGGTTVVLRFQRPDE